MSKICTRCKAQLPDNAMFCNRCGQRFASNQGQIVNTMGFNPGGNSSPRNTPPTPAKPVAIPIPPVLIVLIVVGVIAVIGLGLIAVLGDGSSSSNNSTPSDTVVQYDSEDTSQTSENSTSTIEANEADNLQTTETISAEAVDDIRFHARTIAMTMKWELIEKCSQNSKITSCQLVDIDKDGEDELLVELVMYESMSMWPIYIFDFNDGMKLHLCSYTGTSTWTYGLSEDGKLYQMEEDYGYGTAYSIWNGYNWEGPVSDVSTRTISYDYDSSVAAMEKDYKTVEGLGAGIEQVLSRSGISYDVGTISADGNTYAIYSNSYISTIKDNKHDIESCGLEIFGNRFTDDQAMVFIIHNLDGKVRWEPVPMSRQENIISVESESDRVKVTFSSGAIEWYSFYGDFILEE